MFLLLITLSPEVMSSFPPSLSPDSLSKAAPYALPCSHYSQNLDSCSPGRQTHTQLRTVKAPALTPRPAVSHVMPWKQNTSCGGARETGRSPDLNLKPYLCSLLISAADVGITGEPEVDRSVPASHFNLQLALVVLVLKLNLDSMARNIWASARDLPQPSPRSLLHYIGLIRFFLCRLPKWKTLPRMLKIHFKCTAG